MILSSLEPGPDRDRRPDRGPRVSSSPGTSGRGSASRASTTRRWTGMPSRRTRSPSAGARPVRLRHRRRGRRRRRPDLPGRAGRGGPHHDRAPRCPRALTPSSPSRTPTAPPTGEVECRAVGAARALRPAARRGRRRGRRRRVGRRDRRAAHDRPARRLRARDGRGAPPAARRRALHRQRARRAPGAPLGPAQIHDSNSSMLWAAAVAAGASAEIRDGRRRHRRGAARRARRGRRRRPTSSSRAVVSRWAPTTSSRARCADEGVEFVKVVDAARQAAGFRLPDGAGRAAGAPVCTAGEPRLVLRVVRGVRASRPAPAHAPDPREATDAHRQH